MRVMLHLLEGSILSMPKDVDKQQTANFCCCPGPCDDIEMPEGSLTQVQNCNGANATQTQIDSCKCFCGRYGS